MLILRKNKQTLTKGKQTGREKEVDRQINRQTKMDRQEERCLVDWFNFMAGCFYDWLLLSMFGCSGWLHL